MTPQQTFSALLQALTHHPEDHQVDALLADLAASTVTRLHDLRVQSLKLACLHVTNPVVLTAADQLLQQYGLTLRFHRHNRFSHLISIRHTPTNDDQGAEAA